MTLLMSFKALKVHSTNTQPLLVTIPGEKNLRSAPIVLRKVSTE